MAGWTNRGKYDILNVMFRAASVPGDGFAVFLATNATAPGPDTNTKGDLTEIAVGNGYSADGIALARNSTDTP